MLERRRQRALMRQPRVDGRGLGRRHDIEASRRKLNGPDLPLRSRRAERLPVQLDIDAARIASRNWSDPFASTVRVSFAAIVMVKRTVPLLDARTHTGFLAVNCT